MTEHTTDPSHRIATLEIETGRAMERQAARAEQERADAEAGRSIAFEHDAAGQSWRVHIAPATARGNLQDEGFAGEPDREALEGWVASNRALLAAAAERKITAGAVRDRDVWVHTHDFRQE
jgi:hypothetical protein